MASYRAVYLTPDGTQLSDVAVTDFDWLEELFEDSPSGVDFEKFGPWFDMAQDREKAFLFHESCWSDLIEHFDNGEVDLNRLFEVCKNIPGSASPSGVLDFGKEREDPWHPLERPIIRGIGDATKNLPKAKRENIYSSNNPTSTTDCFGLLAIEIRLEIASYLSTIDFFSLRYASRAMAPLFQLQSFWKTRFRVNGDRGFLAYLAEAPQSRKKKNWRSIYHWKQVAINFRGQKLRGFDVFLGDGGIQAIRPIFNTNTDTDTRWIGDIEGKCDYSVTETITTQLILEDGIKAISGKFDMSEYLDYKVNEINAF
ncbi:hypothetical protein VN97_g7167 [Penicillium thymicola]|uniref:F-box domain-containing protein n=1 Tax=Penicillium thymicola TaxID=293382 RepID=A0AAI9X7M2_PENTH|nr:hypothetical protein VN97_g7167 [Penicillium thymicola]